MYNKRGHVLRMVKSLGCLERGQILLDAEGGRMAGALFMQSHCLEIRSILRNVWFEEFVIEKAAVGYLTNWIL